MLGPTSTGMANALLPTGQGTFLRNCEHTKEHSPGNVQGWAGGVYLPAQEAQVPEEPRRHGLHVRMAGDTAHSGPGST